MTNRFLDAPFSRSSSFAIASLQIGVISAFSSLKSEPFVEKTKNVSASGGIISFPCTDTASLILHVKNSVGVFSGERIWNRATALMYERDSSAFPDAMQKRILVFSMNNENSCCRRIYAVPSRRHTHCLATFVVQTFAYACRDLSSVLHRHVEPSIKIYESIKRLDRSWKLALALSIALKVLH